MLHIQVDEQAIKQMYEEAIFTKLEELDASKVFWDTRELKRRTCMSWNTIQEHFFHDPRFPKVKLGGKWFYPGKETERFLDQWLKEKMELSS